MAATGENGPNKSQFTDYLRTRYTVPYLEGGVV